ncbi:hypothetical protein AUC70_04465 [Methyloceanibacter stevinii]|uniref:Amidohydrolase-related domain-containing protein n=1 Tax=Methyloceanibacter stevinii TaxID=1774970 RepID=A0A1E3VNE0_9HYPH|nr:formimidoylglutamate deiminase [Methyloceanibacter stevinii]ODR95012.1 hypothetical protein AUC70_04465 [Methyloceanibacter stevinii]
MTTVYEIEHLYQADGWLSPGYVEVGGDGIIVRVSSEYTGDHNAVRLAGFGVPGLQNLHSHAFQRALVGRTEFVGHGRAEDNLWNWREEMYRLVDRLTPDDVEAIAALVYLEMLQFGTTTLCEFQYLHHQPGGGFYENPAEMSERLIATAERIGLRLTLLPVLYGHGGIGVPPQGAQLRFVHSVDDYLTLVQTLRLRCSSRPWLRIGLALHSLRAVTPDEALTAVESMNTMDADANIHIHVSETVKEVADVENALGARPVEWLLDNVDLNHKWCLVHATHLDASELAKAAKSGAVVGLCPLTEAMLGDGLFQLVEYHDAHGSWGIGTDSQCSTSIAEELRVLECGKRLELRRRNVIARSVDGQKAHSGRILFDSALAGGARASGQGAVALAPGEFADLVLLDPHCNTLLGHGPETVLDAWILGGTHNPVRDVMVAGRWIIHDGRHAEEAAIRANYRTVIERVA